MKQVEYYVDIRMFCVFHSEPKDIYHELLQKRKASYGLGVAVNLLGLARIEVNYCFPVTQRSAP